MIRLLVAVLAIATFLQAQEPVKAKRIESLSIDVQACKLTWMVTEGTEDEARKYTPTVYREFSIDLEKAEMEDVSLSPKSYPGGAKRENHEVREFDPREAASVHRVTNALVQYVVDSLEWWDKGEGRKKPEGTIAKAKPKAPIGDRP